MKRVLPWLIALVGIAALVYFLRFRPIAIEHSQIGTGVVLVEALGTGSIESRRTVEVGFEVTGRVATIHVDQGDKVKKGQELARLDDRTFNAEVALARQEVALAENTLVRLKTDIEQAQAVWKGSDDSFKRVTSLVESGTASVEALDQARERHDVAAAGLARSQAAYLEGQGAIVLSKRKLERALVELARTVVRSPFEGVILKRVREAGDVVSPGTRVLVVAATDTIWASVWVDETHLDRLEIGLPAKIVLRSESDRSYVGRVARIGREVDRETRELLVDVAFDKVPDRLAFGQRVDLWIELARKPSVLRLPAHLLTQRDGKNGVFVDKAGTARFQPLEIGAKGRFFLEIKSGLTEGDLILNPHLGKKKRLEEGTRVRDVDDKEQGQE